ncbi:MAG: ISNCY family transposase, partial [Fusobacteriaceae bacterium]
MKYQVIKKLVESSGNKERAAVNLNCSVRHINRLAKGYSEFGRQFFIHGNRDKKPSTTLSYETQEQILSLFRNKYYDFNFKHFFEKLQKHENINCSYTTVVSLLYSKGIISPKSHKKTKKKIKKAIAISENPNKLELQNEVELAIDPKKAHPRMSRSKYFGELIQMDASHEYWFGKTKSHLHIAIDDSTGMIVGAHFDTQETLNGYYQVTAQILKNYGIPAKFLTDKRTVFEYK